MATIVTTPQIFTPAAIPSGTPAATAKLGVTKSRGAPAGDTVAPTRNIVAPVSAFPNGVPGNAMVLIPLGPNGQPVEKQVVEGPVALTMEQVWKLLGFNGPAVQVQDEQGRPIAIGLEDLLSGLEKHWKEANDDLDRALIQFVALADRNRSVRRGVVVALDL